MKLKYQKILYKIDVNLKKYLTLNKGSIKKLAKEMNVSHQSVRFWSISYVPAKRVIPLYLATNKAVHPSEMRPDLYPPDLVIFTESD